MGNAAVTDVVEHLIKHVNKKNFSFQSSLIGMYDQLKNVKMILKKGFKNGRK